MENDNPRQFTYVPPDSKLIQQFAREACLQLTQKGNPAFSNPEVISGLANYLNFTAQLIAKYLNGGHHELLDNRQLQS